MIEHVYESFARKSLVNVVFCDSAFGMVSHVVTEHVPRIGETICLEIHSKSSTPYTVKNVIWNPSSLLSKLATNNPDLANNIDHNADCIVIVEWVLYNELKR